ncbi:MAG TPA: glycosyltransferase [bacterium]|nr:glycosyltransferase [bacterium]
MDLSGKRVLLTTSHWSIGSGGSVQMLLLARALRAAGAHVEALFKYRAGQTVDNSNLRPLVELGVPLHFLRTNRWYSPRQIYRLRRILRQGRFDIVHTHKGGDLSLALLAGVGLRVPCLINTRGVNFPLGLNRGKYNLRRLDRVIVVSEDSKRAMVECGVRAEKIRVIYGGVDAERFRPRPDLRGDVRAELGLPTDAVVSLVVANLVRQKGHGDYLEAAAALRAAQPRLHHVFAGSGDATPWRETAERLGVADRVVFAGFRRDMERVYAAADLSVMPGFAGEGVSGVLREALACGVPVITTAVGGNAELIADGVTGLVVPVRAPQALAEAIGRLAADAELRRRLAEAGREQVLARYSAQARAETIFALYAEVFAAKGLPF